jgi:hypothetical protein
VTSGRLRCHARGYGEEAEYGDADEKEDGHDEKEDGHDATSVTCRGTGFSAT